MEGVRLRSRSRIKFNALPPFHRPCTIHCTLPANKRLLLKALVAQTSHPACPRVCSSSSSNTQRPPPSPHQQPHTHSVRARTASIAAHARITNISWNSALPLCPPHPRAATDAAVLEMGHNSAAKITSLQGARGPVGDRERARPGGVDPSTLARIKNREHV